MNKITIRTFKGEFVTHCYAVIDVEGSDYYDVVIKKGQQPEQYSKKHFVIDNPKDFEVEV